MDKIIELLKEKHGGKLELNDYQSYHLFLKDGVVTAFLDQDTKTLKIEMEFLEEGQIYIYHSDERLEDLIK